MAQHSAFTWGNREAANLAHQTFWPCSHLLPPPHCHHSVFDTQVPFAHRTPFLPCPPPPHTHTRRSKVTCMSGCTSAVRMSAWRSTGHSHGVTGRQRGAWSWPAARSCHACMNAWAANGPLGWCIDGFANHSTWAGIWVVMWAVTGAGTWAVTWAANAPPGWCFDSYEDGHVGGQMGSHVGGHMHSHLSCFRLQP
jgi:hypothetical protein